MVATHPRYKAAVDAGNSGAVFIYCVRTFSSTLETHAKNIYIYICVWYIRNFASKYECIPHMHMKAVWINIVLRIV